MARVKTLIVGIVAVCSNLFLAPRFWPNHPIAVPVIAVVVTSILLGLLWPTKSAPKQPNSSAS
jgi:hypothetical protein